MFDGAIRFFDDGGGVMYFLLLCSLVSLTVVIERSLFHVRRWRGRSRAGLMAVLDLVKEGNTAEARRRAEGTSDSLLSAVALGLDENGARLHGALEIAYSEEERHQNRYLGLLDTIITLAPLLGILGTVLGIIESFDLLGTGGARDPMAVTGGVASTLITTAAGLSIAMVTLLPYNYFRARSESALSEIEEVATYLETYTLKSGAPDGPVQV